MLRKIITDYWRKPIPTDKFDWSAHFDGEEEEGSCSHGATEAEAISNLILDKACFTCDCCEEQFEEKDCAEGDTCNDCYNVAQSRLETFLLEFQHWRNLTDKQRGDAIRKAMG